MHEFLVSLMLTSWLTHLAFFDFVILIKFIEGNTLGIPLCSFL
jgi:hypothetical protein